MALTQPFDLRCVDEASPAHCVPRGILVPTRVGWGQLGGVGAAGVRLLVL